MDIFWADWDASSALHAVKRESLDIRRNRVSFFGGIVELLYGKGILCGWTGTHAFVTCNASSEIL
jgi:hypothetical protein